MVVLFSVPGAFTPTCDAKHLPGFVQLADQIRAKGVDTIACMAVNDVFVMNAWGKASGVGDKVLMLADGNGEYAKALGLELDAKGYGMGTRGQRFAIIVRDGVATRVEVEAPGAVQGVRGRGGPQRTCSCTAAFSQSTTAAARSPGRSGTGRPTRPISATSKIGASPSLLMATMVRASLMPVRCWMAPEMPIAMYSSGRDDLAGLSRPASRWARSRHPPRRARRRPRRRACPPGCRGS